MRNIFRAIARILRRVMRRLRAGAAHIDGFFAGLFGGGAAFEEVEEAGYGGVDEIETPDFDADQRAQDLARQLPVDNFSPATAVKEAVELRSAGRPFAAVFDLTDPEQRRLCAYVTALDEHGMRAVRCMPHGTLERHLDSSPWIAVGLRQVDVEIIRARDLAAAKAAAADQKLDAKKPRKRSPSADLIASARAAGRSVSLDDVVRVSRPGRA